MASDLTQDSDRIVAEGRALVADNRNGGRHRKAGAPIGAGSAAIRRKAWLKRAVWFAIAVAGIVLASGIAGFVLNGIGFWGVVLTVLALVVALGVFALAPAPKPPPRADINTGSVQQMVGKTELWLEHQRAALPAPAAAVIDDMGVQLDALGLQLETVDAAHPAAHEVRKLVGEVLPETVDSYNRIPANLRREERGGMSPDTQLTESLTRISAEIESVTRQLAEGSLDDLAIKHRYLDYRYGKDGDPAALKVPEKDDT
ncbi:MAG: hypothetical protein WA954_05700 [Parerythrobacter sp.]